MVSRIAAPMVAEMISAVVADLAGVNLFVY